MTGEKGSVILIIIILVFLIACSGAGAYYFLSQKTAKPENNVVIQPHQIATSSADLQNETAKKKLENAIKLIQTRDKLWISSFSFFQYKPGSKEELENIIPVKITSETFLDVNTKNYTTRIDSELIQKTTDNQKVVGYLDVDSVYIDSIKKTYLKETSNGQTGESWIEIDENNPPGLVTSTRTDFMKYLIEDSINIYDKKGLSDISKEKSSDSKVEVEVITANIDPASLSRVFNGSYGMNGKYLFDFSNSNPKIKFIFEGSRLREINSIFQEAHVSSAAGETIGTFNGSESIGVSYTDDGLKAKEITVPQGNITRIEDELK